MRLLDRHILRELGGPFLFGIAAFTSLFFAGGELFKITNLVAEYNASILVAVKLVLLSFPAIIVLTLPMSMLLSALLGFGRLSGDSESIALFASGVSLHRIIVPVILMAVFVTGGSYVLSEVVAPRAFAEHERIFREYKSDIGGSGSKPFVVVDSDGDKTRSVVYVPPEGLLMQGHKLQNVVVIQYTKNAPAYFTYAKVARWRGYTEGRSIADGDWVLEDGYVKTLDSGKPTLTTQTLYFSGTNVKRIKLNKTPDDFDLSQKKPEEMSFGQLRNHIHNLAQRGLFVDDLRVALYQKISMPFATLVFALIGAPLGLRPQRGSSAMGLGLSIVIIFAYWVLMHYLTILGDHGTISPVAAAFLPTMLGIGAGTALIIRAAK